MVQPLWKTLRRSFKNLKLELPYDPAIPLLGKHPDKTIIQKDTCTPLFIAALFTIAKTCACVLRPQLCPTLCNTIDCSPPGSTVHGIFQARILEWIAISYSRGSSRPKDRTLIPCISCIGRQILTTEPFGKFTRDMETT